MTWQQDVAFANAVANGQTPHGYVVSAYVRSTGQQTNDPAAVTSSFYSSISTAIAASTSGRDIIVVLPGHSEAVGTTLFTSITAGTKIIGAGSPDQDDAPTLNWSTASDNLDMDVKNIMIANLRLNADANDVTEAISVSKAGCKIIGCYVDAGIATGTDILSLIDIETGGEDCVIAGNTIRCTAGGATFMVSLAATVDNPQICDNRIFGTSNSTTVGLIRLTAAATNIQISGNVIDQQYAASTAAISMADVAATGVCYDNYVGTIANAASPATAGIVIAGSTNLLVHFFNNYSSDGLKSTSGILAPAVTS